MRLNFQSDRRHSCDSVKRCSRRHSEPLFEELEPRQMLAADLALTSLVLGPAGPVTVGAVVSMTPTYRNLGNAPSQASDLRIVLSRNAIYGDADDVEIFPAATGLSDAVAPLAAGAQLVGGALLAPIPVVTPGQYRVIGHVAGATPDANTANDTFVLTTALTVNGPASGPDLVLTSAFTAGLYRPGDTVSGELHFANLGPGDVAPFVGHRFAFFLSTDGIFGNADDIPLTNLDGLPFDSTPQAGYATPSGATDISFLLPNSTPAGSYRVIAVADPDWGVEESNEANNVFIPASSTIVVGRPDIQVTLSGNATVTASGSFSATLTTRNSGTAPADQAPFAVILANGPVQYQVMVSGPASSRLIGAGQTIITTGFEVPVPINVPAGTYRVTVLTDPDDLVPETPAGELNNNSGPLGTVVVQAAPGPIPLSDLAPANAAILPGINSAYQNFSMSLSVLNLGSLTATNPSVDLWLSTNTIFGDGDDVLIRSDAVNIGTLAPGGQDFARVSRVLPDNISNGNYFVFVHLTAQPGEEDVFSQSNNTIRVPITIQNPDLIGTISAPTAAAAGSIITPAVSVRNTGLGVARSNYDSRIYLRPASAADAAMDILLLERHSDTPLAAGAIDTWPLTPIALPDSVATGSYRLVLQVDELDFVDETPSENNFFFSGTIAITNPGNLNGYDLAVRMPAVTGTFIPNQRIPSFTPSVMNIGDAVDIPIRVGYYLSTNPTFDATDVRIADIPLSSLAAGVTSIDSVDFAWIPHWVPGGNYYLLAVVDYAGAITEYNETNNVSSTPTASITVIRPAVSIAVVDPTATEVVPGSTPDGGAFRITRTGLLDQPLVVNYTVAGTANSGADYVPLPGRVVIPAGQNSVLVPLTVLDDTGGEAAETVVARLGLGEGYSINLAANTATVTINDNEPRVTAALVDATGTEVAPGGAADGVRFSISRTGPTTSPLLVYVVWEGSASSGDCDGEAPTFVIPAGQSPLSIPISVVEDVYGEPAETLTMRVTSGAGYAPGVVASVTATIYDNEPIVTVAAVDAVAAQLRAGDPAPANNGQFRFTRTGPTTQALTVYYNIGGTAPNGDAYVNVDTGLALTGIITIPAGQASALLTIGPRVFPLAAPSTVTLTVDNTPNVHLYRAANPNSPATVTIVNLPPINLAMDVFSVTLPLSPVYLYTPGQSLPVQFSVRREGLGLPVPAFATQIRLSQNAVIGDGDDMVLMTINTPAGNGVFSLTFAQIEWDTLPAILPGEYHLGLFIDSGAAVGEYNEIDNRQLSGAPLLQFLAAAAP